VGEIVADAVAADARIVAVRSLRDEVPANVMEEAQ
jgi:hypothetical protein